MKHQRFRILLLSMILCLCLITKTSATQESPSGFTDVPAGAWYYDALEYATMNGFISGTSKTSFSPSAPMSRAQFVTILGRVASADVSAVVPIVSFEDVKSDTYYAPYIYWAVQNGYASGTSSLTFSPDRTINREQMAVILANYIELSGNELEEQPMVERFTDSSAISSYAIPAMEAMRKYGILSGDAKGNVEPQKLLSRCDGTAVMVRFSRLLELGKYEPVPVQTVSIFPVDFYEDPWMSLIHAQREHSGSTAYELDYGSTITIASTVYPENATNPKICYLSSNANVASVSADGVITGKGGGTAIITAMSANGCRAEITVSVNGPTIIFDPSTATSKDLVKSAMELIPEGDTRYKIQMIHDLIVNTLTYDPRVYSRTPITEAEKTEINALFATAKKKYTNPNDITLYTGYGVCEDYANLFHEMCTRAGIQCRKIVGKSRGEGHAWNQIYVDGTWYSVDCTWDDPISRSRIPILRYDYFMISMEEMAGDHYWKGYGYPYTMKYDSSWNSIDITNITSKQDWYKAFIAQLAQRKTSFTMTATNPDALLETDIAYNYTVWSRISPKKNGNSYTYTVSYR